jgi:autotransporter-associated beta strand protein
MSVTRRRIAHAALMASASFLSLTFASEAQAACNPNPAQPLNAITTDGTTVLCTGSVSGTPVTVNADGVLVDINGQSTNVSGADSQFVMNVAQVTQNPGQMTISAGAGQQIAVTISATAGLFATGSNGQYLLRGTTGNQQVVISGFFQAATDGFGISLGDGDDTIAIAGSANINAQGGGAVLFDGGSGNDTFSLNYNGTWQHDTIGFEVININPNTAITLTGSNADATQINVQSGSVTVTSGAALGVANSTVDIGQFGNLTLAYTASASFDNTLTGSGGLNVDASGSTITFGGNGSLFTGAVEIGAGTTAVLEVLNAVGTGAITNNGTISWADFNLANNIGGTGRLVYTGVGTGDLSGNNSFSGGIDIRSGSLQVENVGALGTGTITTTTGDVILQLDNSGNQTLANNLTGALVLAKTSGGILGGTGTNTYTGGLDIQGGSVGVTGSGALGSGAVTIASGASLDYTNAANATFANGLSGAGAFNKLGAGQLTFANNFTLGALNAAAGRTRINVVATTNATVASGATRGGTGRIVGNLVNNGTVAPGNCIGTLTVQGNYTHNAGSVLEIEFDANGNIDLLNVTGNAVLNGGTIRFVGIGGAEGQGGTFLSTGGTVTGTFSTIETVGAQLPLSVIYTANTAQMAPSVLTARPFIEFQVLGEADVPIENGRWFRAVYEGTSGYRVDAAAEGTTDLFSIPFIVDDPEEPLALFMAIRENLKEVKVNGVTVQPDVPLSELQGPVTSEPAYFRLPRSALRPGVNVLTIAKDHEGMVSALPEFSIGPAQELAQAYRWKSRYLVDIPIAGIAILGFTIALCLAVNWPKEDQPRMRWLMGFLGSNMLFTLTMTFNPLSEAIPLAVSGGIIISFQILISLTMAKYVALDVGAPPQLHRAILWITGAAVLILGGIYAASLLSDSLFETAFPLAIYRSFTFSILMTVPCILALCWAIGRGARDRWLERMIVIVCLSTFAMDRLSSSFDITSPFDPTLPISLYWSPIVAALLGSGMILSIAREASEARRTVVQSNAILAAQLVQQNAKLEASYEAQKQLLQREVMLVERQRIVRDMHDGIGGQLLGLMMKVRGGGASPVEVEQGLQASIADLRLIVDSMDSADEGLAETLRSLEHRVRSQIEAAGIALEFFAEVDEAIDLGPRPTLQVLRILQEAVTNAMRHSGARRITVKSLAPAAGPIRIAISDDGTGLTEGYRRGRGLTSMETRARNLCGQLTIASGPEGTCLTLDVPISAAAAAD